MNQTKCIRLIDLLKTVIGLRQQLKAATDEVKAFFKANKVTRTPENMEQIANIMRELYGANAVEGLTSQGSIKFRDNAARLFYFREINPYIPALRKRSDVQTRKANPEKQALGMAKRMKEKYGKQFCKTLGALLLAS